MIRNIENNAIFQKRKLKKKEFNIKSKLFTKIFTKLLKKTQLLILSLATFWIIYYKQIINYYDQTYLFKV